MDPDRRCPCHSGRKYRRCCAPWHAGRPAPDPEALMRSRYAAYALGLVEYVIRTTDPEGPQWVADRAAWERSIRAFCAGARFVGLRVHHAHAEGDEGEVAFTAGLSVGGRDASFTERSRFRRGSDGWRYHSGVRLEPPKG